MTIRDLLEALEAPVEEGLVSGLLRGAGTAAASPFGLIAKGAEAAAKRLRAKKVAAKKGAAKPKTKAAPRAKPAPKPGAGPQKPRAPRVTGADAFRRMSVKDLQRYVRGRNPSARTLATRELARRAKARAAKSKTKG